MFAFMSFPWANPCDIAHGFVYQVYYIDFQPVSHVRKKRGLDIEMERSNDWLHRLALNGTEVSSLLPMVLISISARIAV